MSDIQMISVPSLEYVALRNLDKAVRVCMANPSAGEFLVEAFQALNAVRRDLGIEESPALEFTMAPGYPIGQLEANESNMERQATTPQVSALAKGLIERAMERKG